MVAEAGQSQGVSVGRCERAQEGTGGAMGGGDALTHPTPHTLPTEATGCRTHSAQGRGDTRSNHTPQDAPQATQGGRSSAGVAQGMAHRQSRHRARQGNRVGADTIK